jgi:hypothetical protein
MSKQAKTPEPQKKPSPKEVEIKEDGNSISSIPENELKLIDLAKSIQRNQESIKIMKLELTEKDRVIKQILDKLDSLKIRRPPIRPPHYYQNQIEENPYLDDDLEYWQVNSTKPLPMPKSWISQIEKVEIEEKAEVTLPKIMTKKSQYRSTSNSKTKVFTKGKSKLT